MNAEDILNAVSSGSDGDDYEVEKLIQQQMKQRRDNLQATGTDRASKQIDTSGADAEARPGDISGIPR